MENWNGFYFRSSWLCQAGLEVHLGHGGNKCPYTVTDDAVPATSATGETCIPANVDAMPEFAEFSVANDCNGSDDGSDDETWASDEEDLPESLGAKVDAAYGNGLPNLKGGNIVCMVDTSGVHRFRVHLCECPNRKDNDLQYFEMGLFPASLEKPKTAFTFRVLDDLRLTNLECHTPYRSYWKTLVRKTSCEFPLSVPVRS